MVSSLVRVMVARSMRVSSRANLHNNTRQKLTGERNNPNGSRLMLHRHALEGTESRSE